MKLITLNIWGGQIHRPLLEFIRAHRDIDIFCFQEVYHQAQEKICDDDSDVRLNIFSEIGSLLPDHQPFFRPAVKEYGIGMFVKKGIDIVAEGEICIHEPSSYPGRGPTHRRNLQWIRCKFRNELFTIMNVHGLWNGNGKTDTPERILQSQKIQDFMDSLETAKILCGDFNLRPDTESIRILEKNMRNLIHDYKVSSTRTSLYPKQERFADYIFSSHEIPIHAFQVLPAEVSDHAPLFLDFS